MSNSQFGSCYSGLVSQLEFEDQIYLALAISAPCIRSYLIVVAIIDGFHFEGGHPPYPTIGLRGHVIACLLTVNVESFH